MTSAYSMRLGGAGTRPVSILAVAGLRFAIAVAVASPLNWLDRIVDKLTEFFIAMKVQQGTCLSRNNDLSRSLFRSRSRR
jgi:hypothetical protein